MTLSTDRLILHRLKKQTMISNIEINYDGMRIYMSLITQHSSVLCIQPYLELKVSEMYEYASIDKLQLATRDVGDLGGFGKHRPSFFGA